MASIMNGLIRAAFRLYGVKKNYQTESPPYQKMRRRNFTPSAEQFEPLSLNDFRLWHRLPSPSSPKRVIFWFHGGGYSLGPFRQQFEALAEVCQATQSAGYLLDYPKAPEHDFSRAKEYVQAVIQEVQTRHPQSDWIWMGDSSGGGLALSQAMQTQPKALKQIIALSPWVDLSLSQPEIESIEARDPFLSRPGVLAAAKWFAGKRPLNDPELSPLFGPVQNWPFGIQLYSATDDILHPQIVSFYERQRAVNPRVRLTVGKDLLHVWPLMPIPEAKSTRREWVQMISNIR